MTRRLLMTADAVGGVWTYALELARALVPFGIDTTLATMGPLPTTDQIADAAAIPGLDLVTSTFALEWMEHPWDDVRAAGEWLVELESRVQPFVVHLNGFVHAALRWRAPVLVVGHSCVVSWHEAVGGDIDAAWLSAYREAVTAGIRAADCVVAPSATMLSALQRHYGPLRRAAVVENGRDPSAFRIARKAPFVLTAGRLWDRAKNVDALRRIADRLSWPLVAARGLPRHVMTSGLLRASIFALPARYEPFGLLPLEAALSRCALVLGDVASLREIWGDAALYVDPDDADALHAAIESLIADPRRLQEYAGRAHSRARRYSVDRMASRYARIYDDFAKELRCAS